MSALDLTVYLVTDTGMCGGLDRVAAVARASADNGATLVQVRDPDIDDAAFLRLARSVVAALAGTGVPVLLNDRVHLVAAVGADGAHVGKRDLDPVSARALLGPTAILGLSVESVDDVVAARNLPPGTVDYLGASPVWQQQTKPFDHPPLGPDGLAAVVSASDLPVVAIGGCTAERADTVRGAGADGMAVVSAICRAVDPGAATCAIADAWKESQS